MSTKPGPNGEGAAQVDLDGRQVVALWLGRLAAGASRRLGRGGGTALPGLIATTLAPDLIEMLPALGRGVVAVTGTNGKTTTTHLLAAMARHAGLDPLTNRSGSNLERGLVSALVDASAHPGGIEADGDRIAVLEVDEAALPALWPRLRPRLAVVLNLFRDQLDRYGEVDSVAEGWRRAIEGDGAAPALVLNADDPSVAQLAQVARGPVVTFGVEDPAVALAGGEHASDARFCRCGARFDYTRTYVGHVGHWRCPGCHTGRPLPDVSARLVTLGADETRFELALPQGTLPVTLPLAGLYSVYNALAAAAAAVALELPLDAVHAALEETAPAFGRQERFEVHGREVRLLLAKNPAGLNEVMRALAAGRRPLHVLWLLNDDTQDGRDVSWIYDADIEQLSDCPIEVVASGRRADDLALRLHLAGIEPRHVLGHVATALEDALALVPPGERLEVVATYTAMLEVREALALRSGARHYWEASR